MLKGTELGAAIRQALIDNGKRPADAAAYFGIKPPSVNGWLKTGRISKERFNQLVKWLDKTPHEFWGDDAWVGDLTPDQAQSPTVAGHIRPYSNLSRPLEELGKYLSQLDDAGKVIAKAALNMLVDTPGSFANVAEAIEGQIRTANGVELTARQHKSISSNDRR